jgi:hypothetical protein
VCGFLLAFEEVSTAAVARNLRQQVYADFYSTQICFGSFQCRDLIFLEEDSTITK